MPIVISGANLIAGRHRRGGAGAMVSISDDLMVLDRLEIARAT